MFKLDDGGVEVDELQEGVKEVVAKFTRPCQGGLEIRDGDRGFGVVIEYPVAFRGSNEFGLGSEVVDVDRPLEVKANVFSDLAGAIHAVARDVNEFWQVLN